MESLGKPRTTWSKKSVPTMVMLTPVLEAQPRDLPAWSQGFEALRSFHEQEFGRRRSCTGEEGECQGSEGKPPGVDALRNYVDRAALLSELRKQRIRLVKPEFLINQYRKSLDPLPSRQGIPDDSFLDVEALSEEEQRRLDIIAVSYCWLDSDHPDPKRYHLETLAHLLECFCASSYDTARATYMIGGFSVAKWNMRDMFGFAFGAGDKRPVGIFLDWVSLFQDKPHKRTGEQSEVYDAALRNINLWFAHRATMTWALSYLPPDSNRPGYYQSGWPTFERAVSAILSPSHKLLDITDACRAQLVSSQQSKDDFVALTLEIMDRKRSVPQEPSCFNEMIEGKYFTNCADKDRIVKPQYAKTFKAVVADAASLSFVSVGFGDAECRKLMAVVRGHCSRLRMLDLSFNDIRTPLAIIAELIEEQQSLTDIKLTCNRALAGDVECLSALTRVRELRLASTAVTGDVSALAALTQLTNLTLGNTAVSGEVASLAGLTQLVELNLYHTSVTGDLAALEGLAQLVRLSLSGTAVSGDVAALAGLARLQALNLGSTSVAGDVGAFGGLAELAWLNLAGTGVTGDVSALAGLERLTEVYLGGTRVAGDVAALRQRARERAAA